MSAFEVGPAPGGQWTKYGIWRANDQVLTGRFNAESYGEKYADMLLAYGLERLDGRTLRLALPTWAVEATRARAGLLTAQVECYDQADLDAGPAGPMSVEHAIAWFGGLGEVEQPDEPDGIDGPAWLLDLVDWVETMHVERIHRSGWNWHFRGRQVLRIRQTSSTVSIVAGVNYSKPTRGQPAPVTRRLQLGTEPDYYDLHDIRAAVSQAVERRRRGLDDGHKEHLLQAALGADPSLLGMVDLHRELPAWRPTASTAGRGFIDFVGIDVDERLHAIETKIGDDAMLGLQSLDYWAWVTHHRTALARRFDLGDPDDSVDLDVVLGEPAGGRLIHRAAAATLDAIDARHVDWRVHVVRDWNTIDRPAQLLRPRTVRGIPLQTVPEPEVLADG